MKFVCTALMSYFFVLTLDCPFTTGFPTVANGGKEGVTESNKTHDTDSEDYTGPIGAISKCISNCLYHHSATRRLKSHGLQKNTTHEQTADMHSQLIQAIKSINLWMKHRKDSDIASSKDKLVREEKTNREGYTPDHGRSYTTTSTRRDHFCYRACFTSAINDVFVIGERNLGNIAFTAHVLRDRVIEKPNETIRFDEIALNNGLGYDFKTGVFTCPLSGEYFFAVSINTDKMHQIVTELVINDHVMMRVHPASRRLKSNQCSPGIITNLQIGEQVFVRTPIDQSDVKLFGRKKSTFMGFRIK